MIVNPARHVQPTRAANLPLQYFTVSFQTDFDTATTAQAVPQADVPATAAAAMQG